jgi:thymidylate synthase ThyX
MRIRVYDEFQPETAAMLQALYSRSSASVESHIEKIRVRGSSKFMESYYVGYGHASIGDCGFTTLFIEDISLLACKAIQDTPLFAGQETSTRYIDFSTQRIVDPAGRPETRSVLARWMDFYNASIGQLRSDLMARFPCPSDARERVWQKAIEARCFDVLRGFLPAGVTSQTAWTTSLRHAHDHLARLKHHPLQELRSIAQECLSQLRQKYPSSFSHEETGEQERYLQLVMASECYYDKPVSDFYWDYTTTINNDALETECGEILASRPRRAALPRTLARFGHYAIRFALDFGSFRDLQRHRNGLCRMPLLSTDSIFHSWYFDELPKELRVEAKSLVSSQMSELRSIMRATGLPAEDAQYYLPLGLTVPCELVYDLPQMVYVAELRSSKNVHPTLRQIAHKLAATLSREHPKLALHIDSSPDVLSIRRGEQDIVERSRSISAA